MQDRISYISSLGGAYCWSAVKPTGLQVKGKPHLFFGWRSKFRREITRWRHASLQNYQMQL